MSKRLELTTARRAIIDDAMREWLVIGLSTAPADFEAAETAMAAMYARIGKKRPHFVRLPSPFAAEIYLNLLVKVWPKIKGQLGGQLGGQLVTQLGNQFGAQLGNQLGDQLWDQLCGQLGSQLWGQLVTQLVTQLRNQLGDQLRNQFGAQLGNQLGDQLWDQLEDQFGAQLEDQLRNQLGAQLEDQLRNQLGDQLWDQLWGQLEGQLWGQLGDQLWGQLGSQLQYQKLKRFGTWMWGAWDSYLTGWLDGGRRVGAVYPSALADHLNEHCVVCCSVGWVYPFQDFVILTDRPEHIHRNGRGALHNLSTAALRYRDGYSLYAVNGVRVPELVIERPAEITIAMIDAEQNTEVRRVMLDRYGHGREDGLTGSTRFLRDAGAEAIHTDPDLTLLSGYPEGHPLRQMSSFGKATLWRRDVPDDEPIVAVEVINSTPEHDGSVKSYMLRVPPDMTTCRDAVAWTFGRAAADWQPSVET